MEKTFIKEKYLRYIGIIIVGMIYPLIITITDSPYYVSMLFCIFYTFLSWNTAYYIVCFLRKKFGGSYQTKKRLMYEVPLIIISMFLINIVLAYFIDIYIIGCDFNWAVRWRIPILAVVFSLCIVSVYESVYIYHQLQASILESQKFQTENIKSQFEVLKNQIDPHFLFNSLNTLASIIEENKYVAINFAEKLSQVYRYILQNKDKELIDLATELEFVNSYIFLLKIRFENKLIANFNVDEKYYQTFVPPLSLQILVENAIKHNILSSAKPLQIDIYINENTHITIKNNLQPKNILPSLSHKIGLDNIIKRYEYLTKKSVQITKTNEIFEVNLPLIEI